MTHWKNIILWPIAGIFILLAGNLSLYAQDFNVGAENLAEEIARKKRVQHAQKDILIEGHTVKGIVLYKDGEYNQALEEFFLVQELDPYNSEASRYINRCKEKVNKLSAKHFLKGIKLYKKGKLVKAADEFELVSEISPKYRESQVYLVKIENELKAFRVKEDIKKTAVKVKTKEDQGQKKETEFKSRQNELAKKLRDLEKQRTATELLKKAQEVTMMLEVDRAYLPPSRSSHKEEKEIETAEEKQEREEAKAKAMLIEQMKGISVPALSLTDADIRDVIRQLMNMTGVTIILDESALKRVTGEQTIKITFTTVNPMPLLDLLELTLKATGLDYKVEPTYIWISDKSTLDKEELVTRVYKLKYGAKKARTFSAEETSEDTEEW